MNKRAQGETFKSVADLVRANTDDNSFAEDVENQIADRDLVLQLVALRAAKGVSQAEIAKVMECGQSRVSKLENGVDDDLTWGDIQAYLRATDHSMLTILTEDKNAATSMGRIKSLATCIYQELCSLANLANKDPSIEKGVGGAFVEVLINQTRLLLDAAKDLPKDTLEKSMKEVFVVSDESQDCNQKGAIVEDDSSRPLTNHF